MQVTETLSDGLKRAFTVVVPAEEIESRRMARLTDLGKTLKIAGFRPGKVPMPVIRQRYGSAVSAEVLESSINQATQRMLTERGLRPAQQPKVDLVTADPATVGKTDLEFKVELELLPDVTLPDFGAITLTRRGGEVPAGAVDHALTSLAERNRELLDIPPEELADRGAAEGEVLTIDYLGRVDGVAFDGGTGTDTNVDLGGTGFIPGFAEQLVGMRPGESRTIDVTFPETYATKDLAGKQATFEITAKQIRKPMVPAIDDALAAKIGFDSLDELRALIVRQMQAEANRLSRGFLKQELLDALSGLATFAAPESMVEGEFAQIWARLESARTGGTMDEADKDKDEETLRSDYRAIADRRVRLGLLLAEVARVNSITVSEDELARAMRAEAGRYPGQEAQMMELFRKYPAAVDSLRGPILEDKVVDFILDLANITQETAPVEQVSVEEVPLPVAIEDTHAEPAT
jgi:trigger factor